MCILHSPLGRSFLNIYIKQYVSYKPVQLKNMRQNIRNRHHSYFPLCCTFYQSLVLVWLLIKDVISVRAFEITFDMPKGVTLRNVINNVIWVNKTYLHTVKWSVKMQTYKFTNI